MFRLPALPGPSVACSGSRPPVVFRRVPARSGVPVDLRPDLSSQLPVHGTLSARRETGTSFRPGRRASAPRDLGIRPGKLRMAP